MKKQEARSIALNRKAHHLYVILDELECGISLLGTEVKSLRAGKCSLAEAYGVIKKGELYLVGANIAEYENASYGSHKPVRDRKLLLHSRELKKWSKAVHEKGMTLIPLQVYLKDHLVKVNMALVRGKKVFDKRAQSKERDAKREMQRAVRRNR
ncbi:MAG: SsrA-binding protein [Planctomycetota bacterium]|jgi:SsrA-binding protein